MNEYLCILICFLTGILIYLLIRSYCGCNYIVEGNGDDLYIARTGTSRFGRGGGTMQPIGDFLSEEHGGEVLGKFCKSLCSSIGFREW